MPSTSISTPAVTTAMPPILGARVWCRLRRLWPWRPAPLTVGKESRLNIALSTRIRTVSIIKRCGSLEHNRSRVPFFFYNSRMSCNHNDLNCQEYVQRITYLSQSARWVISSKSSPAWASATSSAPGCSSRSRCTTPPSGCHRTRPGVSPPVISPAATRRRFQCTDPPRL